MLRPVWLYSLAMLSVCSPVAHSQCWEHTPCRDLSTEDNILECIQACKPDLTSEFPTYPGIGHLQPPSEADRNYAKSHFRPSMGTQRANGLARSSGDRQAGDGAVLSFLLAALSPSQPREEEEVVWQGQEEEEEAGEGQQQQRKREDKRSYSMEHFRWGKPVGRKRRPVKVYPNGVEEESAEAFPTEMRRDVLTGDLDYPLVEELEGKSGGGENEILNLQKKNGSYMMHHFRWNAPPKDKRYGGFMKSWDERSQKPLLTLFKNVIIKDGHQNKGQ
ncbi:proopiomelanocortin a [Amia ocellicauda]|uniref:proopiomelanocortin a n=1 Tax=Amia ocellicauda TaxID=2972642 RepID=UPI003464643C